MSVAAWTTWSKKRADELAYKLATGQAEDNDWNRRMAEPQFRIISEEALVHIDFMWAFHHFNDKPFHAPGDLPQGLVDG